MLIYMVSIKEKEIPQGDAPGDTPGERLLRILSDGDDRIVVKFKTQINPWTKN